MAAWMLATPFCCGAGFTSAAVSRDERRHACESDACHRACPHACSEEACCLPWRSPTQQHPGRRSAVRHPDWPGLWVRLRAGHPPRHLLHRIFDTLKQHRGRKLRGAWEQWRTRRIPGPQSARRTPRPAAPGHRAAGKVEPTNTKNIYPHSCQQQPASSKGVRGAHLVL